MPLRLSSFPRPSVRFSTSAPAALLLAVLSSGMLIAASSPDLSSAAGVLARTDTEGAMPALCPLRHTDVEAKISGFLARVTVTQEFENPFQEKIEAVYTFPLPPGSAVDEMVIRIGERTVKGVIKRREEARAIYEAARNRGQTSALLDQERPNIFTESVANIPPGEKVKIVIRYVETLRYDDGVYQFSFPMVVGPRYIPGHFETGRSGGGWGPDTDRVRDGSRITPPVTPPGTRAGHDISIAVRLDAGVPIRDVESPTHEIATEYSGPSRALVRLSRKAEIPNKDFLLRYRVAYKEMQEAILTHRSGNDGFFTLVLQPPERVTEEDVTPKELVFVLDTSGSMYGFPMEKARETMMLALNGLYPRDTFNIITFAGDSKILFPEPVPATKANLARARKFLADRWAGGGTEMMKAVRAALRTTGDTGKIRIVCFMTDGYVGNDMEILGEIRKHRNARVFLFGIGSSVNRFLLDKMADEGRGAVEYVGLNDDGTAAARCFHERIRNPLLTDISVDFNGLPVEDVYPKRIPDLFSASPVVLHGRYRAPASGVIRMKGWMSGREVVREIPVSLPKHQSENRALASVWARARVDDLMSQDWNGLQMGTTRRDLKEAITELGLKYGLMTQFTSFVAVEEKIVNEGGAPRRIEVPVEMPDGVNHHSIFGEPDWVAMAAPMSGPPIVFGPPAGHQPAYVTKRASGYVSVVEASASGKLHPKLAALLDRLRNGSLSEADRKLVIEGKVTIEVWLVEATSDVLDALERLGFESTVPPKVAKVRIGRLAWDKLEELAALDAVQHVAVHQP